MDDGKNIFINDEQLQNAKSSIAVTEFGIWISDKEEQPLNAFLPIFVINDGIWICFNDVQFKKTSSLKRILLSWINKSKISLLSFSDAK